MFRGGETVEFIKYPTKEEVEQVLKEDCETFFGKDFLEEIRNIKVSDGKNIMEIMKNMPPDYIFVDGKFVPVVEEYKKGTELESKDNDYIFVEKNKNEVLSENYKIMNTILQLSEIEIVFSNDSLKPATKNGIQGMTTAEKKLQRDKWEKNKTMKNTNPTINNTKKKGVHTLADYKNPFEKSSDNNSTNLVYVKSRAGGKHKKKNYTKKKSRVLRTT